MTARECTATGCPHTRGYGGHCLIKSCKNCISLCPKHRNG